MGRSGSAGGIRSSQSTSPVGETSVATAARVTDQPSRVLPLASRAAEPPKRVNRCAGATSRISVAVPAAVSRAYSVTRVIGRAAAGPHGSAGSTQSRWYADEEPLSKIRMWPSGSSVAVCWAHGPVGQGSLTKVKSLSRPPSRQMSPPRPSPSSVRQSILSTADRCRNDTSRLPSAVSWTELTWA